MNKLTSIAIIAGLATAFTTLGASAQFTHNNNYPKSSPVSDPDCTALIGYMRTPRSAEILGLTSARVAVIAVCEDMTVPGRNNYGPLFVNGNAELLRQPIARTPALIEALRAKQYDQHDIISVRFGGNDSIILYVHQRDMN